MGSFMRISHVGVFSAKTHEFTTIEELEESKVQDSASVTMMIKMISIINIARGIEMRYMRSSEEECSRKSSSCEKLTIPYIWLRNNLKNMRKFILKIVLSLKMPGSRFC